MSHFFIHRHVLSVLDQILYLTCTTPLDQWLFGYYRAHPSLGAKERKHVQEIIYAILRQYYFLQIEQDIPAEVVLSRYLIVNDGHHHHATIEKILSSHQKTALDRWKKNWDQWSPQEKDQARANCPSWMYEMLLEQWDEAELKSLLKKLNDCAPLTLRVNTLKGVRSCVIQSLNDQGIGSQKGTLTPWSIHLDRHYPLQNHPFIQDGVCEIQDEGSQIIALACDVEPGMRILDYCAGACGKTLALAMTMKNKGSIIATDIHAFRLERGATRLKRAGVSNVTTKILDTSGIKWMKRQEKKFDRVLVDVPCSGTGTWRRHVEQRLRLCPANVENLVNLQQTILRQVQKSVAIGGYLIYSTCSILYGENEAQVEWFLHHFDHFTLMDVNDILKKHCVDIPSQPFSGSKANLMADHIKTKCLSLNPLYHQCDGFFMAVMKRMA